MNTNLTEKEKRDIIVSQIDKSMFVEAGAGAGKTTLIKNRIVNQLKQGILPSEIVAITFTNAATRELRERIVDAVRRESQCPNLKEAEKQNLNRALDTIDQMHISTIHSFCSRILKEKSLDAGIPMDIELLEGAELERKMKECFTKWAEGLTRSDWERLLEEGKYRSGVITKLENLFHQLLRVDRNTPIEIVLPEVDKASFDSRAKEILEAFENVVVENTKNAYKGLISPDITWKKFADIEDKMYAAAKTIKSAMESGDLHLALKELSKEQSIIKVPTKTDLKNYLKKDSGLKGKELEEKVNEKQEESKQCISKINKFFDADRKNKLNALLDGYENYLYAPYVAYAKKARDYFLEELGSDILTNDLLIQKTYQLLASSEEARKYFGNKFKCIYVDEFQDTDHIQEAFIRLLAEDTEHPGTLRDGALFVVGDPKQSIYRFRGAEPEIYFQTKDYFSKQHNAYVFELQDNYRSNSEIIEWVNAAFCAKAITQGQAYVPMQVTKQLPAELLDEKTIHGVYCQNSISENQKDQSIDTDVENVTNLILNLVHGGYEIIDYEGDKPAKRKIDYDDILLLCMNTRDMNLYAEKFRLYGIPVSMDSKISVKEQTYLKVFYRIYVYLLNSFDRSHTVGAVEGLAMIGHEEDNARYILSLLNSQTKEMSPIGILGFLEKNWKIFLNIETDHSESFIRKVQARITQMVGNLMSSRPASGYAICSFLEDYLESEIEHELSLEEGAKAVRFMNLHKAKGLEGNIVIWANRQENAGFREDNLLANGVFYPSIKHSNGRTAWCGYNGDADILSKAKEMDASEKIRLEYVAVTRAKQAVIFMDRYSSSPVLFGDGYETIPKSINDMLKIKNTPKACKPKAEDFSVQTTLATEEEWKKPLFLSESPSDFEDDSAGRNNKEHTDSGDSTRPTGAVLGTVMHRTFELLVGRLITTHGKQGIFSEIGERLVKSCYLQAIQESINDIPKEEVPAYQTFLQDAVMAYGKWWVQEGMTEKIDTFYTELPFSYFVSSEENRIWRHGFADLVLKLKNGDILIIDYKSDSDRDYSEDNFIERLEGKYGPQLSAYRDAIKTIFGIEDNKIRTCLISFSEKNVAKDEKLRVRVTEIQ